MFKHKLSRLMTTLLAALIMVFAVSFGALAGSGETVTVVVENHTYAEADGAPWEGELLEEDEQEVALEAGDSIQDVIIRALDAAGEDYDSDDSYGSIYITSIAGLAATDGGPEAGWMYCVNNDYAAYAVADGDTVYMRYTREGYGTDIGCYFAGRPILTSLELAGEEAKLSMEVLYEGWDVVGVNYYLNGRSIRGSGEDGDPFIIPLAVEFGTDITALSAEVSSTLAPYYLGMSLDLTADQDYSSPLEFYIYTPGELLSTYYQMEVSAAGGDRPDSTVVTTPDAPAAADAELDRAAAQAASWLLKAVPVPGYGSAGDWAIFALCRGGFALPGGYVSGWYNSLSGEVKAKTGVLDERKYSEYSRAILALRAAGLDPASVAGYDLAQPLLDYDKTVAQGVSGAAYALLALDSNNYGSAELRQKYVDYLVDAQLKDGGWALSAAAGSEVDVTAIVLQALAKYQNQSKAAAAIDTALAFLAAAQSDTGSFASFGSANCESTAQVIVAILELGVNLADSRFVKNNHSALDALLAFQTAAGGFSHIAGGGSDLIATEQALYALVAASRSAGGQTSLYTLNDIPAAVFVDTIGHAHRAAIEALAAAGVINGLGDGSYAPDAPLTRAQYAAIVSRALALTPEIVDVFADVAASQWYAPYVGAAYRSGIITGVSPAAFQPQASITREQAALMTARAAALLHVEWTAGGDQTAISRGEAAQLLYQLLHQAKQL